MWLVKNAFVPSEFSSSPLQFPNVALIRADKRWYDPLHAHDWLEAIFCTSGTATATIGSTTMQIKKGTALLIKSNVFHGFFADETSDFEYCVLTFRGNPTNSMISFFQSKKTCMADFRSDVPFVKANFEKLIQLCQNDTYAKDPLFYSICMQLLYFFQTLINNNSSALPSIQHNTADQVLQYIADHYRENLTLDSIASAFSLSASHLSRMFRDTYHISVINYLIDYRFNIAKNLLARSNVQVGQISKLVGYDNVSHFIRLFTKRVGLSPLEHREASRNNSDDGLPPHILEQIRNMNAVESK